MKRQEAFAQQLQGECSALSSLVSTQLEQLTSQQQQQTSASRDWTASLASSVNKVKVSVISTPHDVQVMRQCLSVRCHDVYCRLLFLLVILLCGG